MNGELGRLWLAAAAAAVRVNSHTLKASIPAAARVTRSGGAGHYYNKSDAAGNLGAGYSHHHNYACL